MTAYTRKNLGGGLFVIEWELVVTGGVAAHGDFYTNDGAELLSVTALSDTGLNVALKYGNNENDDLTIDISGRIDVPTFPPLMMKYGAQAEDGGAGSGISRVGLLFRQV